MTANLNDKKNVLYRCVCRKQAYNTQVYEKHFIHILRCQSLGFYYRKGNIFHYDCENIASFLAAHITQTQAEGSDKML